MELRPRDVFAALRRHPSGWLLTAQILAVLAHPFFEGSAAGRVVLLLFGNVIIGLTLVVVIRSSAVNWIGFALAVPAVVLSLIAHAAGLASLLAPAHLLESAVYFYAAISLIHYMLEDHRVTSDEYLAAGASFTLLAWAFAFAFSASQALSPGSFGAVAPETGRTWLELLFLSFSALSGVGITDIYPVTPMARSLVMLAMFSGVMYLALIVSRLIALASTVTRAGDDRERSGPERHI